MTETKSQAQLILNTLIKVPFSECVPITRSFENLTTRPGIYAVHRFNEGLLYGGKAQDMRERFRVGCMPLPVPGWRTTITETWQSQTIQSISCDGERYHQN